MNPLHCFFTLCHPSKAYAAVNPHADATCPAFETQTKPKPMGNEILLTRKASYGVMFKKNHRDSDPIRDFSKLPFLMKLNSNKFLSKKALSSHPDRLNVRLSLIPGRYAFFLLGGFKVQVQQG